MASGRSAQIGEELWVGPPICRGGTITRIYQTFFNGDKEYTELPFRGYCHIEVVDEIGETWTLSGPAEQVIAMGSCRH